MKPLPEKLAPSDLSQYLEGLDFRPPERSTLLGSYQEAAAVLAAIHDPASLRSTSGAQGEAELVLASDLVTTPALRQLGGVKMLRQEVRREALMRLGNREAILRALEANPDERTGPVQARFEQYVRGEAAPVKQQTVNELDESLQAVLWLEGLNLPNVPAVDEVRSALARARFIQPFERLAGKHFRGRATELDRLRGFVGILEPRTRGQQVKQGLSRLVGIKPKPALNLFGSGGMGKSALVMRFFLEHVRLFGARKVPFAYLDFDSPFLNINDLETLETEIFRQLALQFPKVSRPATTSAPGGTARALANLLSQLSRHSEQPFLLVLDTFEEVQYGGEARAYPLWDMLNSLQARWPFLRVLISGRSPVTSFRLAGQPPEPMELTGLDEIAAEAILVDAGVNSRAVAKALVKQVGYVPLSLQLAAAVVSKEKSTAEGVRNLETSSYLLFSVSDEVIQGQLYDRILGHIHDPQVMKLAHPGLVLRKITADLILQVLREPCELSITTLEEAELLLKSLARETALVSEESAGSLSHRADVRRTMLQLLIAKDPEKADAIHRLAVTYYAGREEEGAAAEELYHRLMLGERPQERLRELQRRDVRVSLSRSLSELPQAGQIFLSGFGYEIAPEILQTASKAEHEGYLAAKIAELLPHGPTAASDAAAMLSEVSYRGTNSPLYLEEARVRFLQGRFREMFPLLDEGIRLAFVARDRVRTLDLLCLRTWALEETKRLDELGRALPRLKLEVEKVYRPLAEIQVAAQSLRLAYRSSRTDEITAHSQRLAFLLSQTDGNGLLQVAPLLKDVFVHINVVDEKCVHWVAQRFGHSFQAYPGLPDQAPASDERRSLPAQLDGLFRAWPQRLPYLQPAQAL